MGARETLMEMPLDLKVHSCMVLYGFIRRSSAPLSTLRSSLEHAPRLAQAVLELEAKVMQASYSSC